MECWYSNWIICLYSQICFCRNMLVECIIVLVQFYKVIKLPTWNLIVKLVCWPHGLMNHLFFRSFTHHLYVGSIQAFESQSILKLNSVVSTISMACTVRVAVKQHQHWSALRLSFHPLVAAGQEAAQNSKLATDYKLQLADAYNSIWTSILNICRCWFVILHAQYR